VLHVAVRWLERLGFQRVERQQIAGKLLFVWNQASAGDASAPARRQASGKGSAPS